MQCLYFVWRRPSACPSMLAGLLLAAYSATTRRALLRALTPEKHQKLIFKILQKLTGEKHQKLIVKILQTLTPEIHLQKRNKVVLKSTQRCSSSIEAKT